MGRQVLRREVNRRARALGVPGREPSFEIFCECGRRLCADRLRVDLDVYDDVVGTARRYVVTVEHDDDPAQRPIARHEGFLVVERT